MSNTSPRYTGELPRRSDVVVVGGGIAGVSACYHLARSGMDVLLLERDRIGEGATSAAAGILSPPLRQPFQQTVRFRGEETARLIWGMADRSVQGLREVVEERNAVARAGLDLSGGHVLAEPHTLHEVEAAYRALDQAGFAVEWLGGAEVRTLVDGRGFSGGYRLEGGGCLDPVGTVDVLAEAAAEEGATLREGVEVRWVRQVGDGHVCETDGGTVACDAVVHATHVAAKGFSDFLQEEIIPIRGQGLATGPVPLKFRGSFVTHWKLNVWRQTPGGGLVISGWRHNTWSRAYRQSRPELDDQLQGDLVNWFEHAFPESIPLPVERRWSGVFGWTADYLPLVGPLESEGEFVFAGFSGGGLPFAFEGGRIIARAVCGQEPSPGAELLHPARFARFPDAP